MLKIMSIICLIYKSYIYKYVYTKYNINQEIDFQIINIIF
jgi:hypothetical protein